jgi:hypothetical protein
MPPLAGVFARCEIHWVPRSRFAMSTISGLDHDAQRHNLGEMLMGFGSGKGNERIRADLFALDTQHEEFIRLLEQMSYQYTHHADTAAIYEGFIAISGKLSGHFAVEERVLYATGMPPGDIQRHIQDHVDILHRFANAN